MSSSSDEDETPELKTLDISNDLYYKPIGNTKPETQRNYDSYNEIPKYGSNTILHSLPAYDLWLPFFPTQIGEKFKNFHRPKLRHFNRGPQARFKSRKITKPAPIKNLTRTIYRFQKQLRNRVVTAINRGVSREEIVATNFLIRDSKALSAKYGEIFLFEYSEEHPPVLSQVGMASNVKTFVQPDNDIVPRTPKNSHQSNQLNSSFLNSALNNSINQHNLMRKKSSPNQNIGFQSVINDCRQIYFSRLDAESRLQVIENNLYRAPIYKHNFPDCDFLVVRTRNSFYIRPAQIIFTVGQTMPLVGIPAATETSVSKFRMDLSNVHIHKLFQTSEYKFPALKFGTLAKLFPDYQEAALKRRLSHKGAESIKVNNELVFLPGSSGFGSISKKELRRMFTPEQYCINMTSIAARERLRELNYTESMIHPPPDALVESEVLAAPWNTSKAILGALSGRHYLDLKDHLIDPTGPRREGFSCVAWVKSPTELQQQKERQMDGRERSQLTNGQPVPFFDKNPLAPKIKHEKLERLAIFQTEAKLIMKLQSQVLGSEEVLSSDEDGDSDQEKDAMDVDFDRHLQDLDSMVVDGRSADELNHQKEEEERRELLRDIMTNQKDKAKSPQHSKTDPQLSLTILKDKVLIITRKFDSPEGIIERTEVVREPRIIASYIRQKNSSSNCNGLNTSNGTSFHNENSNGDQSLSQTLNTSHSSVNKSQRLGPRELCRADGTRLIISKKVLDTRAMRHDRRSGLYESGES